MRTVTANSNIARWGTLARAAIGFRFGLADDTLPNPPQAVFARPSPLSASTWQFLSFSVTLCFTDICVDGSLVFQGGSPESSTSLCAFSRSTVGEMTQVLRDEKFHRESP